MILKCAWALEPEESNNPSLSDSQTGWKIVKNIYFFIQELRNWTNFALAIWRTFWSEKEFKDTVKYIFIHLFYLTLIIIHLTKHLKREEIIRNV